MADVSADRVTSDLPPFADVGIDYFGPMEVKRGQHTFKRYGVIFTCLTSHAVHLEVAHTLDTNSCINAIRRFVCRRVQRLRSDNGTNFVSANQEPKQAIKELNQDKFHKTLMHDGIQWCFKPPTWSSSWRSVGKINSHITLKEQSWNGPSLSCAFCWKRCSHGFCCRSLETFTHTLTTYSIKHTFTTFTHAIHFLITHITLHTIYVMHPIFIGFSCRGGMKIIVWFTKKKKT